MGKHEGAAPGLLTTTASRRHIGKVTTAATGGATLGAALSEIAVWCAAQQGIDMSPIAGSLTVVATVALGAVGGLLIRPEPKGSTSDATD